MDFFTFSLTPNGKAIRMYSNYLINLPEVDFSEVTILLTSIAYVVVEEESQAGLSIILTNGGKYVIQPSSVTMVGTTDYKLLPSYTCPDTQTLWNDILNLIGW